LHECVDDRMIHESALKADAGLDPLPDPRGSSQLKREMVRRLAENTLGMAFRRARRA